MVVLVDVLIVSFVVVGVVVMLAEAIDMAKPRPVVLSCSCSRRWCAEIAVTLLAVVRFVDTDDTFKVVDVGAVVVVFVGAIAAVVAVVFVLVAAAVVAVSAVVVVFVVAVAAAVAVVFVVVVTAAVAFVVAARVAAVVVLAAVDVFSMPAPNAKYTTYCVTCLASEGAIHSNVPPTSS